VPTARRFGQSWSPFVWDAARGCGAKHGSRSCCSQPLAAELSGRVRRLPRDPPLQANSDGGRNPWGTTCERRRDEDCRRQRRSTERRNVFFGRNSHGSRDSERRKKPIVAGLPVKSLLLQYGGMLRMELRPNMRDSQCAITRGGWLLFPIEPPRLSSAEAKFFHRSSSERVCR
jgi:hypothetical protein